MFEGEKEVMLALSYSLRYLLISIKANLKKDFQTDENYKLFWKYKRFTR